MSGQPSAMIAAPEALAVDAGAEVLARGGNAIDAAVTCAFVQGVVDPHDSSIGGFALLNLQPAGEADIPRNNPRRPGASPGR